MRNEVEDPALYEALFEELVEDESLQPLARALIDGALRGEGALTEVLKADGAELPPLSKRPADAVHHTPSVFLKQITVEGFRGAGPSAVLDVPPGPGLTLVVGRNGTGKSTFAEALETVLTGTTERWDERKEWKESWKNVGYGGAPRVSATLVAEGVGTCLASRTWTQAAELAEGEFRVEPPTAAGGKLDWKIACQTSRPFLSYRRLGKVVDDPSSVFDTLEEVLDLELLRNANSRIDTQLKLVTDRAKDAKESLKSAIVALKASKDERATELVELLEGKQPDASAIGTRLARARRAVIETHPTLQRLAGAQLPSLEAWQTARAEFEAALEGHRAASTEVAEQSHQLIQLLDGALALLRSTPDHCPVCAKPLTGAEVAEVTRRRQTLHISSAQYSAAKARLDRAQKGVRELVGSLPSLDGVPAAGLEVPLNLTEGLGALRRASAPAETLEGLTRHSDVVELAGELRDRARARVVEADEQFRKLIEPVERWLELVETVRDDQPRKQALDKAKAWVKEATEQHREKRFAPLRGSTLENWLVMSSGSSVLLNDVRLTGHKTRRKLELGVEVDGHEAKGVGVLSQGEINCMALSLFLPKAIHADGPFRFVVIDDPVQAMDQVKVDGLARVLHSAAQELQVVVLTHDARLEHSLRRLHLACAVLEVRRTAGATLLVQTCDPAHERFIRDAERLAKGTGELGEELPRRLVPYFCRTAVESASNQRVFRDQLEQGRTFREIEEAIAATRNFFNLVALALVGDAQRWEEVPQLLKKTGGKDELDALFSMKVTHGAGSSMTQQGLQKLTARTRNLCSRILGE